MIVVDVSHLYLKFCLQHVLTNHGIVLYDIYIYTAYILYIYKYADYTCTSTVCQLHFPAILDTQTLHLSLSLREEVSSTLKEVPIDAVLSWVKSVLLKLHS